MWVNLTEEAMDILHRELNEYDVLVEQSKFIHFVLDEYSIGTQEKFVGAARCPSCSSEDVVHHWSDEQDAPTDACLVYYCRGCGTQWHDRYEAVERVVWEKEEVPDEAANAMS